MRSIILFYFPVWYHAGRFPWGSMGFAGSSSAVPCGSRTFHWIRRKIFLWNPWSSLLVIQRRTMNAHTIQLNAARTGTQTHVVLKCLCNFVAPSTVYQWVSYWYWLSKFHAFRSQRPLWITICEMHHRLRSSSFHPSSTMPPHCAHIPLTLSTGSNWHCSIHICL